MDTTTTRREWSAAIAALFPESDECVFPLIERAIDKEVASTACEAQLWREESLMVDLVGEFVRAASAKPLAKLAPLVREIMKEAKKKEDLEGEALTRWLVACSEKMFKAVLEVIDDSPSLVKRAIKHLYLAAKERFPAFEFRAVGALVGLRCYCPAIVSPELYNLVKPGKEISIVARKALVKIAKLLQNVFNETGVEEDATSPELSQNFIRSCIPKFHSTIFMITEGRRLSDSDINGSGNLPGSIGQAQDADGEPTSPSALSSGMKSLGRKSLFSTKKRTKFSTGGGSSGGGGVSGGDAELTNLNNSELVSPRSPRNEPALMPFAASDGLVQLHPPGPHVMARLAIVRSADDLGREEHIRASRQQTRFLLSSLSPSGSSDDEDTEDSNCSATSSSSSGGGNESSEDSMTMGNGNGNGNGRVYKQLSRSSGTATAPDSGVGLIKRPTRFPVLDSDPPARSQSADSLLTSSVDATVLAKWSYKELVEYLHKTGFSEDTRHAIKKGKVSGEALLKLENASLHALGIGKLGERKRLLKLIREAGEYSSFAFLDRVDMVEWSAEEVARWAGVNGFEEYQGLIVSRGVTGAQLMRMDHVQLSDIGITKWGHRQRILRLIDEARACVISPRSKNRVTVWTTGEVLNWLKATGMEQYQSIFSAERVAGAELLQLTEPMLVQMGVTSLGHRKRLLRNIATLQAGGEVNCV